MEIEHDTLVLPADEALNSIIEQKQREGWMLAPGVQPMIIYHVIRVKGQTSKAGAFGGIATMSIDDDKVMVMRAADADKQKH